MDVRVHERFEERARVMKALGHATRLYMLDELGRGERCVRELTEMVGADMSTVSKHLSVLRSVGLVRSEKRGAEVYYSLAMRCVLNFFGCVESVLHGDEGASCGSGGGICGQGGSSCGDGGANCGTGCDCG